MKVINQTRKQVKWSNLVIELNGSLCSMVWVWFYNSVLRFGFFCGVKPSSITSTWLWFDHMGIHCVGRWQPTSRDLLYNDIRDVLWMYLRNTFIKISEHPHFDLTLLRLALSNLAKKGCWGSGSTKYVRLHPRTHPHSWFDFRVQFSARIHCYC